MNGHTDTRMISTSVYYNEHSYTFWFGDHHKKAVKHLTKLRERDNVRKCIFEPGRSEIKN